MMIFVDFVRASIGSAVIRRISPELKVMFEEQILPDGACARRLVYDDWFQLETKDLVRRWQRLSSPGDILELPDTDRTREKRQTKEMR